MSAETVDLAKTRQVEPAAAAPATASPRPSAAASSVIFTANGSPPKPLHDAEADSTLANSASTASLNSTQQQNPNPQLMALRKIDALSAKLQSEGKLLESLQCLEKSLILRGHIFGLDSVEVLRACKTVGELCNYLSMSFLQQDLFDVTLELLKKAEVLTERHKAVRAVTYNNMACYYRKRGKLRTALNFARKALGIEAKLNENVRSADTHLNMCTILSELKRHEKAIVHARIALKLLLMELFGDFNNIKKEAAASAAADNAAEEHELIATGDSAAANANPASLESLKARLPADRVAVLAIAYHNKAVQEEFLRRWGESLASYEKAMKVVQTHLPPTHPLVQSLGASYAAARKKMEHKLAKQETQPVKAGKPTAAAGIAGGQKQTTSSSQQRPAAAAAAPQQSSAAAVDDEEEYAEEAEGGFVTDSHFDSFRLRSMQRFKKGYCPAHIR